LKSLQALPPFTEAQISDIRGLRNIMLLRDHLDAGRQPLSVEDASAYILERLLPGDTRDDEASDDEVELVDTYRVKVIISFVSIVTSSSNSSLQLTVLTI
jgi:hypothetical protein